MFDILRKFHLHKLTQAISLSDEHCPSYTRKHDVNEGDIILTIGIPYEYCVHWYDLRHGGKLTNYSFNEVLNAFISQHGVQLNSSERINGILRRSWGEVRSKYRKLKGSSKGAYLGFIKKISVYRNDIVKVADVQDQIVHKNKRVELLSDENERLKERCEELCTQIVALRDSNVLSNQMLDSKQKDFDTVLNENKALKFYLEKVGIFGNFENTGKDISELEKSNNVES